MILFFAAALAAVAGTEGWENVCPERRLPEPVRSIWRAPLEKGTEAFSVEWRDGATGEVSVVKTKSGAAMKIAKRNAVGYALVKAKEPFAVPAGTRLRAYAGCEAHDADCEYSYGFLKLFADREDLSYFSKLDFQGRGGPKMTLLCNTPPDMPDRKLSHFVADEKTGTNVYAAIVVAGVPSTSIWSHWGAEDFAAANTKWWDAVRNRKPPVGAEKRRPMTDEEFDALIAAEPEHTARVEKRNGYTKFLLDGQEALPVFFKGGTSGEVKGFYGGAKMAAAGMELQSTHIRFGVTRTKGVGFWSKDGFDVKGAVAEVRKAMKLAPHAKFLLSVNLDAYPEFADEHPDEVWVNDQGRKVFGHNTHSPYSLPKKMESRHWYWMSNHSLVWRDAVKKCLTELIGELKATGLAKKIVGVHLSGYHDAQFATVHPDYSKPAITAFRKWLKTKYLTETALREAWLDDTVTYDTATPPIVRYNYGQHNYFIPGKDQSIIDFAAFLKKGPFLMQEDLSRHVKNCFGKDIVTVRYCMGAFGGTFCSAYDITPFAQSDTVDILCAQPNYGRRVPGLPSGCRLPLESFHRHGKLFFNEFDLRTYGAKTSWESELAALQYGLAFDDPMWCSINRKLAGQMYAKRMGWWYLDMAGGWFEPEGIASDIAGTLEVGRELEAAPANPWHPDVAIVMDEDGALLRNTMSSYFNPDEETINGRQLQTFAASGVPYDNWLLADWLEEPSLAKRYRMIVFMGLYDIDMKREALLAELRAEGRVLVFLTGTGASRGVEKIGFELGKKPFPAQHETRAEAGVEWNMNSLMHESKIVSLLGVNDGWPWQLQSPTRTFLAESSDQKVLARFTEDGTAAVAERSEDRCKLVYVASAGGLTPEYLHHLAKDSGAYVPTENTGLQVNMNGDFISVHCLRSGRYDFKPPRKCAVINLKTGNPAVLEGDVLPLVLTAGETRWYRLK